MFWNLVNPGYGPIALNEGVGVYSPSATAVARIQALGIDSATSQLIFSEDWNDLSAWTVAQTNGSISVTSNVLTVSNTSGGVNLLLQNTAWAGETEPYVLEFDWDQDGTGVMRCLLGVSTTGQAFISMSNTALTIAGSNLVAETVTPANYDHDERHRVLIAVDPVGLEVHFYVLHLDTTAADQYTYLGTKTIAAAPNRITFLSGSAASSFKVGPVRIWRAWGATVGDSIATGSPAYSPVPREEASPDIESQIAYWIEQDQSSSKRVLNLGKGGQGFAWVQAVDGDWLTRIPVKVAVVWAGTNNIGSASLTLAQMQTAAADVMDVLDAAGVLAVMVNIIPRPNYSDPTTMNATRQAYNAWLKTATMSRNAVYIDAAAVVAKPDDPNDLQDIYNADEVHLTVAGYTVVADEVMDKLRLYGGYA